MNWLNTALNGLKEQKKDNYLMTGDTQPPGVKHTIFQAFQVENSN